MGNCFSQPRSARAPSPEYRHEHDFGNNSISHSGNNADPIAHSRPVLTTTSDLVVGIDFGTTFTGVAYSHTAGVGPVTSTAEMRKAVDNVVVIKTWPNQTNCYADKTPSILAYNRHPPTWGGNVKPTDEPRVAHFKLGLQEDIGEHYQANESPQAPHAESVLGGYLINQNWKHPALPELEAVDFAGDYLTQINQHVTKEVLPRHFGPRFLQNQNLSYVITVPAIWSDKAKEKTKQAAFAAGIEPGNLELITEPEAAALYCATLCNEVDLDEGDRFVICDAGGGTVVRGLLNFETLIFKDLISYKVISQRPFKVEECTVGTGAACGAIYLDRGFEMLLRKKFAGPGVKLLDARRFGDLLRQFDNNIKRQFNPFDAMSEKEFVVSIAGIHDIPEIGLFDGYMTLSE
jgi:hypothetical protein